MKKLSAPFAAAAMACLAIFVGLIMNYAPGTTFDDDWSVRLPEDAWIRVEVDGLVPSGTFQFVGGRDGATTLVGKYYLPSKHQQGQKMDGQELPPAIIIAHGLGLMQDCSLNDFIDAFSAEGIAVFTFDYSTFGHSGGLPRHEVDPKTHISDTNAAIEAVRKQFKLIVDVQSIALWGTSLAGGHVISSALSPGVTKKGIRAVVALVPHIASGMEGVAATVCSDPKTFLPALGLIMAGFIKSLFLSIIGKSWYFPLHGEPGSTAAMQNPGDDEGYGQLCAAVSTKETGLWRNAYTAMSVPRLMLYRPMTLISLRKNTENQPPVLLIGAENDTLCPAKYVEAAAKKIHGSELLILQGATHFDVYKGENLMKSIQLQVSFLKTHLFDR